MKNFAGKECDRLDCEVQDLGSSRTLLGWCPRYDRNGNLLNKDPNTVITHYKCLTCNESWVNKT